MTDREIIETLAEKVMVWTILTVEQRPHGGDHTFVDIMGQLHRQQDGWVKYWNPLTSAADSKALRDKLGETWDWSLDYDNENPEYTFALIDRKSEDRAALFVHCDKDEFRAVALCALKMLEAKKASRP